MNSINRRQALASIAGIAGGSAIASTPLLAWATSENGITWNAWRTDANDFHRAPVLLTGKKEAILIDGSFNYPQGRALVEQIKATGKQLSTIYISCSDPDYYFNLAPVKAAFPDAKVLAASETIAAIRANVDKKLAMWGPKLGEHGPQRLDDIVFATAYDAPKLKLEGNDIEIVTSQILTDRRYIWVPSLQAAFGGVYTFNGLHLWTADMPTRKDRAGWLHEIETVISRKPKVVVAAHGAKGVDDGLESLVFTRDYLIAFEQEVTRAKDSKELIAAMKRLYPGLGLEVGLEIGAKVVKGEMQWG